MSSFPAFLREENAHYWLHNVRLPLACLGASVPWQTPLPDLAASPWQEELVAVHIEIRAGRMAAILPSHQTPPAYQPAWDLRQGMVWPCFVDSHTHLDKAHTWPRTPNPDGTFGAALDCANRDRRQHWQATDLLARMNFALQCSYAHGTQAIRTHLDSLDGQAAISLPVFHALQEAWADKIVLQAVCLVGMELYDSPDAKNLAELVAHYGGILGGVIYPQPGLREQIDRA
ncbi:MAG: cytosine deaminase, partial [Leptolyngbyaceae cyanobacterium SM2_5_2]|nr:cytosine deaminase [Leptolyngbyaceae cyanobacterium SM2_5_2]